MSSGDHLGCSPVIIVAERLGYDGAGANEVIVLVQKKTGPRELPRTGLSVAKVASRSVIVPGSALVSPVHRGLTTPLPPGCT